MSAFALGALLCAWAVRKSLRGEVSVGCAATYVVFDVAVLMGVFETGDAGRVCNAVAAVSACVFIAWHLHDLSARPWDDP